MLLNLGIWVELKDGDREAFELFKRHYSYREYADGRRERAGNRNRFQFIGPGKKVVLLTPCGRGLFVWRHHRSDMCAFLYLEERFPNEASGCKDMVAGARHDEIWLDYGEGNLNGITEEDVIYLIRCGVRWDNENDSLAMFV